jgi:uncharacterized membrane protein (UPF0127 family)
MPVPAARRIQRLHVAVALAVVVAGLITACAPAGSGDARSVVRVGDREWTVLLAGPDGMRHRDGFDGADGMLFDLDQDVDPGSVAFVMDGVRFPLDIAWFTDAGALVGVASMAVCPAEPCPTYAAPGRYRWAIESPPGSFDHLDPADRLVVNPSGAGG